MAEGLQNELIDFMFRRHPDGQLDVMQCLRLWFGKSSETDIEIEERFGTHVTAALDGSYSDWHTTPRGCLARMILVDQFPRNLYRNNVRSFAGDRLAREIAYIDHQWLDVLKPEECLFIPCLVMTHQEDLTDQNYGIEFYEKLEPLLPTELHIFRTIFEEHRRIIYLCGTFPHRDHYYPNRKTSEIGRKLMDNPKLRFDLPLVCNDGIVSFGHDPSKLWEVTQRSFDVIDRIDALINHAARRRSTMIGPWLTPGESAQMKSMFRTFDKDGSGFLDVTELVAVLESTGHIYTLEQVQEVVDSITGVPASTGLTFAQFANILRINLPPSDHIARSRSRFELFDLDHSGEVSFPEFAKCINSLDELITSSEVELMFKRADQDNSGSISFDEFLGILEERVSSVEDSAVSQVTVSSDNRHTGTNSLPAFSLPVWTEKSIDSVRVVESEVAP
jgi:uncharacterized protein (DUF924 family)/Ca2+-binding EF-hand superfamily protein